MKVRNSFDLKRSGATYRIRIPPRSTSRNTRSCSCGGMELFTHAAGMPRSVREST